MPDDLMARSRLRAIDSALEQRQLDRALNLAREFYDPEEDYKPSQLLLLSITFSATIRWDAGVDLEEKVIAHRLWKQATVRMNRSVEAEAAHSSIRLAEIYIGRREKDLAHYALSTAKHLVSFGAVSLRYNQAVDAYVALSGRSDTDLWIK